MKSKERKKGRFEAKQGGCGVVGHPPLPRHVHVLSPKNVSKIIWDFILPKSQTQIGVAFPRRCLQSRPKHPPSPAGPLCHKLKSDLNIPIIERISRISDY